MNKSEHVKTKEDLTFFLLFAIGLIFFAIVILNSVSKAIKHQELEENANYVQVEATVVEYKKIVQEHYSHSVGSSNYYWTGTSIYYSTFYEYESPSGVYYACWQAQIKTEEEARAQIGMKVPIYIDDELKLQTKSLKIDKTGVIIGSVFGTLLLLASIGSFIKSILLFAKLKFNSQYIKESKEAAEPTNHLSLHFTVMVFSVFILAMVVGYWMQCDREYQAYVNRDFVEVEGSIYEYKVFKKDNSFYYATFYKYVDLEGNEYTGFWSNDIRSINEANLSIGSKVPLYYDSQVGVIKSLSDLEEVEQRDHTGDIIAIVVCSILIVNSLTRFIIGFKRIREYNRRNKMKI